MSKILMVNNGFTYREINYGGVNKMFLWLGNTLANDGYDVTFCSIHDQKRSGRITDKAKSIELAIPANDGYLKKHLSYFWHSLRQLNRIFRSERYDYVLNFDGLAFYVLLFLRLFRSFKLVVSERADPNYNQSRLAKLKRILYRYVDVLVCQTDGAKKCFAKKTQSKVVVIPNPIDIPKEEWKFENTEHQIAHVARLHVWQKRQDILLRAFSLFVKTHPDYKLNIYGGGPDENMLINLSKQIGISEFVFFHGNTSDVRNKLLKNELFVLTSDFEGMPNALMEAMALGMPVVSTKCSPGGAEVLISDGENGFLTECGDADEIAKSFGKVVDNHKNASAMGHKARKTMEQFKPQDIIKRWEEIIC